MILLSVFSESFPKPNPKEAADSSSLKPTIWTIFDSRNPKFQKMDESDHMTEYKRQFQWALPMVEAKPPKPEPMVSQYQLDFGVGRASSPPPVSESVTSRPNSVQVSATPPKLAKRAEDVVDRAAAVEPPPLLPPAPAPVDTNKLPSSVLFNYEPPPRVPSPIDRVKQSEYHAKFKPFDEYVYVEGAGFKKETQLADQRLARMAKSWVSEVEERSRQACKYRARSRNGNPSGPGR